MIIACGKESSRDQIYTQAIQLQMGRGSTVD